MLGFKVLKELIVYVVEFYNRGVVFLCYLMFLGLC